jgi:hypothetical protein
MPLLFVHQYIQIQQNASAMFSQSLLRNSSRVPLPRRLLSQQIQRTARKHKSTLSLTQRMPRPHYSLFTVLALHYKLNLPLAATPQYI